MDAGADGTGRAAPGGPGAAEAAAPVVALEAASRAFGAVRALDGVTLAVRPGEVVGLVGHNGAGKSTLVNLLTGALAPTGGRVAFAGGDPRATGVRAVAQELSLAPNLSAAENLAIPQRDLRGLRWRRAARARIGAALDAVFPGHGIDPDAPVSGLSLTARQMAEVAMAFAEGGGGAPPRLVILDEPTSSLDAGRARQLLDHVARFRAGGGAAIFISHVLGEVLAGATRIVVLRDGRVVADRPAAAFDRAGLVEAMGHAAEAAPARRPAPAGAPEVVRTPEGLVARAGEVVGLTGLAGHGQAEALVRLYLARTSDWRGTGTPPAAFVAGDRARDGVMPLWSIARNASLGALGALTRGGLVDRGAEARLAADWQARLAIRTPGMDRPILSLSGGNQQKALFARALATGAPLILMDDPTRGVDVGTKREVYGLVRAEAGRGRAVLWYSTETEEVTLCDRAYVFRSGRIVAELAGAALTEEAVLRESFEMGERA